MQGIDEVRIGGHNGAANPFGFVELLPLNMANGEAELLVETSHRRITLAFNGAHTQPRSNDKTAALRLSQPGISGVIA